MKENELKEIVDVVNKAIKTVRIGLVLSYDNKLEYTYGIKGIGPFISIETNSKDKEQVANEIIENIMSVEYIAKGEKEFEKFNTFMSLLADANDYFEGRNMFEFMINAVDIYCEVYDLIEYKEVFKQVYRRRQEKFNEGWNM